MSCQFRPHNLWLWWPPFGFVFNKQWRWVTFCKSSLMVSFYKILPKHTSKQSRFITKVFDFYLKGASGSTFTEVFFSKGQQQTSMEHGQVFLLEPGEICTYEGWLSSGGFSARGGSFERLSPRCVGKKIRGYRVIWIFQYISIYFIFLASLGET